ncbi:MAG: hypothetical protein IT517_03590 [Burkholderiales bacterium]|nr:hypothetical protein [Burkholderiales bacterium]
MKTIVHARFTPRPLVLAMALAAGAAQAAPTPNQMPGNGLFAQASLSGAVAVNGVATPLGSTIINLPNGTRIDVQDKVVLRWGVVGGPADVNPAGFNLGAGAQLTFGGSGLTTAPGVLIVDVSGNPSQVYGTLVATNVPWAGCPVCNFAPAIWLANANGIVIGPGAHVVAPKGVGLVGADLDNATSRNEFVGNNGWVAPAAPAYGTSYVSFGTVTGNVSIAGAINGDLIANAPAPYVFVAGDSLRVLNTGNLFGGTVYLQAGLTHVPTVAAIDGVAGASASRSFSLDSMSTVGGKNVGPFPGYLAIVGGAGGDVVNEGSIAAGGPSALVSLLASGSVRSGMAGSSNTLVGLFSDATIEINSYSDSGKVELYNVVSGYTTNASLQQLGINVPSYTDGFSPDVTIQALTPGAQPSAITTTGYVDIFGGNVLVDSTINHQPNPPGVNTDSLLIVGTKSVTIRANIGAGDAVGVEAHGPLVISGDVSAGLAGMAGGLRVLNEEEGAPTTISGTLFQPVTAMADLGVGVVGPLMLTSTAHLVSLGTGITVENFGTAAGNTTTVAGVVEGGAVIVRNGWTGGPVGAPLVVSGAVRALDSVTVWNYPGAVGNTTTISGTIDAGGLAYVVHQGTPLDMLTISGSVTAGIDATVRSSGGARLGEIGAARDILATVSGTMLTIDGPWTAGNAIDLLSPLAMTRLTPAGVLTAPTVMLEGLSFTGVNAAGAPFANIGEKPTAQVVTNDLEVTLTGSINAPVAGNTNWLLNSMDVAPLTTLAPVLVSVSAESGGFQAVNLRVLGDAIVDSGATRTPFIGVPLTTGGLPAGGIQGNLGSQLILQADGYMRVMGAPTGSLIGPPVAFQWPGGAVFRAGTTLQTFAPVYNAWTTTSPPFGGIFFEAPFVALGSYLATSGTAWANFSTPPVTGDPTVYQIRKTGANVFGFAATTAFVKNAYSQTVTGGTPCVATGPTTWTACP